MKFREKAHDYQHDIAAAIAETPACLINADAGMGKTASTLLAILNLFESCEVLGPVLVVAPKRVAVTTWPAEASNWEEFQGLKVVPVTGDAVKRRAALKSSGDIFTVSAEGVQWVLDEMKAGRAPYFSMIVVDESSKFKNSTSKRWKALKKNLDLFPRRVLLTATPMPKGIENLFAQMFLIDKGDRLGRTITGFRGRFMENVARWRYPNWQPIEGADKEIASLVSDVMFRFSLEDYNLPMPPKNIETQPVDLPPTVLTEYRKFQRTLAAQFGKMEAEKVVFSAGTLYGYLRQVANGGLYLDEACPVNAGRLVGHVHDEKTLKVREIVAKIETPVMIAYHFQHDLERILKAFPNAKTLNGSTGPKATSETLEAWNLGEIDILCVQPQAMSHGLNMQKSGRDLIWYGLPDDLEMYIQTNARLWRQGAALDETFNCHHVLARDTVDEIIDERIAAKDVNQRGILELVFQEREMLK